MPTLREIILRYLLSPSATPASSELPHAPATPHNSPMRRRVHARPTISNLAAYIQTPLSLSDLPPSAHILETHGPGLIARQSFSRVSTTTSVASTVRDEAPKGVSHCMSPMHGHHPGGTGPPFIEHTEERIVWAHVVCGITLGTTSGGGVPLLWRGCERGCLSFLDDAPTNRDG